MRVQVQNNLYQKIKTTSRVMGVDETELIDRALLLYLRAIQQTVELRQELKDWDELSDEAFMNMECGM